MSLLGWWNKVKWNWQRRVAQTTVGDEWVSTVYIGFPGMPPEWKAYETMVFGDYDEGLQVKYRTRKEAKAGHWRIVNKLREDKYG